VVSSVNSLSIAHVEYLSSNVFMLKRENHYKQANLSGDHPLFKNKL